MLLKFLKTMLENVNVSQYIKNIYNSIQERQSAMFLLPLLVYPLLSISKIFIKAFFTSKQLMYFDLITFISLSVFILSILFLLTKKYDSMLYNLLSYALNTKLAQTLIFACLTAEQLLRLHPIILGTTTFCVGFIYLNNLLPGDHIFSFIIVQSMALILGLYSRIRRRFLNQYAFSSAGLHIKENEQFTWNHIILGIEKVLIQSTAGRFETRISITNRFPSSASFYFLNQKRLSSSRAFFKKFVKESFDANPAAFTMALTGVLSAVGSCAYTISKDVQTERETERRHQEQMCLKRAELEAKNRQFEEDHALKWASLQLDKDKFELEKKKFEQSLSSSESQMIPCPLEQYSKYCFDPSQLCSGDSLFDLFF